MIFIFVVRGWICCDVFCGLRLQIFGNHLLLSTTTNLSCFSSIVL